MTTPTVRLISHNAHEREIRDPRPFTFADVLFAAQAYRMSREGRP